MACEEVAWRRRVKKSVGGEKENFVMFCEEVAWKQRVKKFVGTKREFCYNMYNDDNNKSDHDINDNKDNSEYGGIWWQQYLKWGKQWWWWYWLWWFSYWERVTTLMFGIKRMCDDDKPAYNDNKDLKKDHK